MRFAVPDKNTAVGIDEYSVGPVQLAAERITIGAVATFASAGDEFDCPGLHVYFPNRVTFGVGQIDIAVGTNAEAFRAGEGCLIRRAAIPGEPGPSSAGHAVHDPVLEVEFINGVALAERDPKIALPIKVDGARTV